MSSRERVTKCITFAAPDRVPMTLPKPFPNDITIVQTELDPDWTPSRTWSVVGGAQWEDEWGNVWKRFDNTTRGEVIEGALKDWAGLDSYTMPRLDLPTRYAAARQAFELASETYNIGVLPGFPFAIMRYLRTMEEFLVDVLLHPSEVIKLQEMLIDLLKRCIGQWKNAGADGVMFFEDWGTQERLLVSPECWRRLFRPGFEEIIDYSQSLGVHVWMHSCGYIKDIVPDLRDIGVTVLQLDQPELLGIDWLHQTVGGRMTVWSPVDIQRKLTTGDKARIQAAAREYIDKLGCFNGGFIAGYYGDPLSLGIDPEWQMWACEAYADYASSVGSSRNYAEQGRSGRARDRDCSHP